MCDLLVNDDDRSLPPGRLCELFGAGGEDQTIVTSLIRAVATGGTCLQISVQKSQPFGVVVPDRLSSEHGASPRNSWVGLRHRPAGLSRALPAKATADAALRTATGVLVGTCVSSPAPRREDLDARSPRRANSAKCGSHSHRVCSDRSEERRVGKECRSRWSAE